MSEDKTTSLVKSPTFSGSQDDWPFFKAKLTAYLAKQTLDLLTWKGTIPKDDFKFTGDPSTIKKMQNIQKENRLAAGLLLQAINTDKDEGKATFYQVEKFMDPAEGYAGGHFPKAWQELCNRFEETETLDLVDLQQEYFDMKMEEDEEPSLFIVKLERMKKKLRDNGHKISDEDFLRQILAKLPKGKEDELGPYQVEKRSIALRMEIDKHYGLTRMKNELEKVYKDVHAERKKKDDEETDVAMTAYSKQFKGRCNKCGKYGHKAADCRGEIVCYFCNRKGHTIASCHEMKKYKEMYDNKNNSDEANAAYEIAF